MVSPLQNYCEGRKGIDRNGFPSPELLGGQVRELTGMVLSRTTGRAGKGLRNGFPSPELLGGQERD